MIMMTTEIRNWAVVAAAMEAKGATNSEMYRRAKVLAEGQAVPTFSVDSCEKSDVVG